MFVGTLGSHSACRVLVWLVASFARASTRSLPSIFVWLGTQYRVVRLPHWFKAEAELIIFVVISGYVRIFVCARILMPAIESECMKQAQTDFPSWRTLASV